MGRPVSKHGQAVTVGLALVVAGFWVLYRTYDGSGRPKPRVLGPFLPW